MRENEIEGILKKWVFVGILGDCNGSASTGDGGSSSRKEAERGGGRRVGFGVDRRRERREWEAQ